MLARLRTYALTLGWPAVGTALSAKVTGRQLLHRVIPPGCHHPVHLRLPSSDVATFQQIFVDREYAVRAARPPSVIVDAGANIGLASIWFATQFPDTRIIAIEPEAGNFALLVRNTQPYPNIEPVRAALWNEAGDLDIVDPGLGHWGFRTETGSGAGHEARHDRVRATTVTQLLADLAPAGIDILKIDIEGAEREVFDDTSPWLEHVESLIVELHERLKAGCNRAFYAGSTGFAHEWHRGEHVFVSRGIILPAES